MSLRAINKIKKEINPDYLQLTSEPKAYVSSGWMPLDLAMGGGFALPKLTILSGEPSSGKTLLALNSCRNIQKMGGVVLFFNAEDHPVINRAKQVGVDTDSWLLLDVEVLDSFFYDKRKGKTKEGNYVKGFFETATEVLRKVEEHAPDKPVLLVLDSVSSTPIAREMLGQPSMGGHAAVMGSQLRGFCRQMKRTNTGAIFTNHLTQKMGIEYGKETTFVAERQQTHSAVVTVEMVRAKKLGKTGEDGQLVRAYVTKNKVSGQRTTKVEFPIYYSGGIPLVAGAIEFMASISERTGFIQVDGKYIGKNKVLESIGSWRKKKIDRFIAKAQEELKERAKMIREGEAWIDDGER